MNIGAHPLMEAFKAHGITEEDNICNGEGHGAGRGWACGVWDGVGDTDGEWHDDKFWAEVKTRASGVLHRVPSSPLTDAELNPLVGLMKAQGYGMEISDGRGDESGSGEGGGRQFGYVEPDGQWSDRFFFSEKLRRGMTR